MGVKVSVDTANITTMEGCEEMFRFVDAWRNRWNILFGCYENQSTEKLKECIEPKANATRRYLDELSRSLCFKLQYFDIFWSASCGRGSW